jgi:hypothetical protein
MPFEAGQIPEGAKPFKKNDPRINRDGRPKLPDISEALEAVLNEEKDGLKALDAVLRALRNKAIKGDVRAIQELLDRAYGKSKQHIDHTTKGEAIKMPTFIAPDATNSTD